MTLYVTAKSKTGLPVYFTAESEEQAIEKLRTLRIEVAVYQTAEKESKFKELRIKKEVV